jgi:hypothetical protein
MCEGGGGFKLSVPTRDLDEPEPNVWVAKIFSPASDHCRELTSVVRSCTNVALPLLSIAV